MNVLNILENWDSSLVQNLVSSLNRNSIVSDEEHNGLSSTMVEHWTEGCDAFLENKGYEGGKLKISSKYFSSRGQIYVLYDSSALSAEDAYNHMVAISKR